MLIQDLFVKDVARPINGVVYADQNDPATIFQELDEYVVTRELRGHFSAFFSAWAAGLDRAGDPASAGGTGVWVSGFFGSGKSHFIKILSYLMANQTAGRDGRMLRAVDFFDAGDKIQDPMVLGDMRRSAGGADVVLFNIDSKADRREGPEALLSVFLRVFNEMQGFSGDHPHVADLERDLAERGRLADFHDAYEKAVGVPWVEDRDAYALRHDEMIQALGAAGLSREAALSWLAQGEQSVRLTIENFARRVAAWLDRQPPNHRIVFLVDEVGQFIGRDGQLMLNLQTITENLGTICNGRAWIVVTSQEAMETVLGEMKSRESVDFSKITGRFRTRLSLSSNNTDEVIRMRLLSKTDEAATALKALYAERGDIVRHQISFPQVRANFRNFGGAEEFAAVYPFAPYQFLLIQKVFEAIRKHGVAGAHLSEGERSMLDAFQSAARSIATEEIGVLVPLWRFYSGIESFLDTAVKRTIAHSADNRTLDDLDCHVLQTLFLIRYVKEMTGTVENLVTLFIDRIDADRIALTRRIQDSLLRLENQSMVSRNGDEYAFLTNEEKDIAVEIKAVDLSAGAESDLLAKLIFDEALREQSKHTFPDNRRIFTLSRRCDLKPYGRGLDGELTVQVISSLCAEWEMFSPARCIGESTAHNGHALVRLTADHPLERELRLWLKTDRYVRDNGNSGLAPTRERILHEIADENRQRWGRLVAGAATLLLHGDWYVNGRSFQAKAATAPVFLAEALNHLIRDTYKQLSFLKRICDEPKKEIQAVLRANDMAQQTLALAGDTANPLAVDDVRTYLDLSAARGNRVLLSDLTAHCGKYPRGWPEEETILIVARLAVLNEVVLMLDGAALPPAQAYDPLSKPQRHRQIVLMRRRRLQADAIAAARLLGRALFHKMPSDAEDELVETLRAGFKEWQDNLRNFRQVGEGRNYPGLAAIDASRLHITRLLAESGNVPFIDRLLAEREALDALAVTYRDLAGFFETQRPIWDKLQSAYTRFSQNRGVLERNPEAASALQEMRALLEDQEPYQALRRAEDLIAKVGAVNETETGKRREQTLARLDILLEQVRHELAEAEADPALSNASLHPLQQIRSRATTEQSIPHLLEAEQTAAEAYDDAMLRIEAWITARAQRNAEPAETAARPAAAPKPAAPRPPKPAPRPRRVIKPAELTYKPILENREDVEAYLALLRKTLEAALEGGARIELR